MAELEKLSKALIRDYLRILTKSFKLKEIQSETALKILFEKKLYAECVLELMRKMDINNKVKLTSYADFKFPNKNASALIILPNKIPRFDSQEFVQWKIPVFIRQSLLKDYSSFLYNVLHELSHLVLHSAEHELRESEVATDLFVLVCGFEEIMKKGRMKYLYAGTFNRYGYLDDIHFNFALLEINNIRTGKKDLKESVKDYLIKIIKKI